MGPYIVTVYYTTGTAFVNHKKDDAAAHRDYQHQIRKADCSNSIESVTLTRGIDPGCLLRRWVKGDQLPMHLKYAYKIHGIETANDPKLSAKTAKWYETEEQATKAATQMAKRSNFKGGGVVIYKAFRVVRQVEPQVTVEDVEV